MLKDGTERADSLVVSLRTAAALVGVALTTIRKLVGEGRIDVVRFNKRVLVRRVTLERFIAEHETAAGSR